MRREKRKKNKRNETTWPSPLKAQAPPHIPTRPDLAPLSRTLSNAPTLRSRVTAGGGGCLPLRSLLALALALSLLLPPSPELAGSFPLLSLSLLPPSSSPGEPLPAGSAPAAKASREAFPSSPFSLPSSRSPDGCCPSDRRQS